MPRFLEVTDKAAAKAALNADFFVTVEDYGAVGDGVTDDFAALQAALDAVEDGETLFLPPGRYLVGTGLTVEDKSIHIKGDSAVLVQNASIDVLTISGEFEAAEAVSSVTSVLFNFQESTDIPGVEIELSSSPSWQRGDVVKLVADDEMPGARPSSTSSKFRTGQFFVVHEVDGTTVTLAGSLHDPFTTNIRVARLVKHQLSIDGLRIESSNPAGFGSPWPLGVVVKNFYAPRINISFGQMPSVGLSMESCYKHRVDVVFDGGNVAPSSGLAGYAVRDLSGEFGQYNVNASYARHAYDDGAFLIAADHSDIGEYGRPYGHIVTGVAANMLSAAWSTHTQAQNVTFAACKAVNSSGGFVLRGRNNTVTDGVVSGCTDGLHIFDEDRVGEDSDSSNHLIDGLTCWNVAFPLRVVANAFDATAPSFGVRESAPTIIRNVHVTGAGSSTETYNANIVNQTVVIENAYIELGTTIDTNGSMLRASNSDVTMRNVEADWTKNTTGTGLSLIRAEAASIIRADKLRWNLTSDAASRVTRDVITDSGTLWDVTGFTYNETVTNAFANASGVFGAAGSKFDFLDFELGNSTSWQPLSDANITDATFLAIIGASRQPVIHLAASPTANRTLAKLPDGSFRGQILVVQNANTSGGYRLAIGNSTSSFTTSNLGGRLVSLYDRQSAGYTWTGSTWRQLWGSDTPATTSTASSGTPSINSDLYDQYNITALAADITAVTVTGTPKDGQRLRVRIKGTATRTIAWGADFTGDLLTTTSGTNTHIQELIWDAAEQKWAGVYADTVGY